MSKPVGMESNPAFSKMDYAGSYSFDRDTKDYDSRIAVKDVECLRRGLDYSNGRFLLADCPLTSPATDDANSTRDTRYQQVSSLLLMELQTIEKGSLATKASSEGADEQSRKINIDAEACFTALLTLLKHEIGEFITRIGEDGTWEALLKKVIKDQYSDEQKHDYKAFNEFVLILFGATYYGTHNANGELKDKDQREEAFQTIKSTADLRNCVGGASGALFNLFQIFSTERSFWTAGIKQSLILQLSSVCKIGNITHLDAWLEHLLTGVPGPDKTVYFASMDMPMEDVRRVLMELSYNRANLIIEYSTKEVIRIVEEVRAATIAQLKERIAPNAEESDQDYWGRIKESKDMESTFTVLLANRFDEIKIPLVLRVLRSNALDIVTDFHLNMVDDVKKIVQDETGLRVVKIPQPLAEVANILLICNSYLAKYKPIPLWLKQMVETKFGIKRKTATNLLEEAASEKDIVSVLEDAAKNLQKQGIFIKLIKIEGTEETKTFFATGYHLSEGGGTQFSLQTVIDDGITALNLHGVFKRYSDESHSLPETIHIDGLFFHPQQEEIIQSLNQNQINLDSSCFERAINAGDASFITTFAKEFAKHAHTQWRLYKVPNFSIQKLELLSMALSRSEIGVAGAQGVMQLIVENNGRYAKENIRHQIGNIVDNSSDKIMAIMIFRNIVGDEEFIRVLSNYSNLVLIVKSLLLEAQGDTSLSKKKRMMQLAEITVDVYDSDALTQNLDLKKKSASINKKLYRYFVELKYDDAKGNLLERSYRHSNYMKMKKIESLIVDINDPLKDHEAFGLYKELAKEGFLNERTEIAARELLCRTTTDKTRCVHHQKRLLRFYGKSPKYADKAVLEGVALNEMLQYILLVLGDNKKSLESFLQDIISEVAIKKDVNKEFFKYAFCQLGSHHNIVDLHIAEQINLDKINLFKEKLVQIFPLEEAQDMIRDLLKISIKIGEQNISLYRKLAAEVDICASQIALKDLVGIDNLLEIFGDVYLDEIASSVKDDPDFLTSFPLDQMAIFLSELYQSADDGQKVFIAEICFELSDIFKQAEGLGSGDLVALLKISVNKDVRASRPLIRNLTEERLYADALPYLLQEIKDFPAQDSSINDYINHLHQVANYYLSMRDLVEAKYFYNRLEHAYNIKADFLQSKIDSGGDVRDQALIIEIKILEKNIAENNKVIQAINKDQEVLGRKRKATSDNSFEPLLPVRSVAEQAIAGPKLQPQAMVVETLLPQNIALHDVP